MLHELVASVDEEETASKVQADWVHLTVDALGAEPESGHKNAESIETMHDPVVDLCVFAELGSFRGRHVPQNHHQPQKVEVIGEQDQDEVPGNILHRQVKYDHAYEDYRVCRQNGNGCGAARASMVRPDSQKHHEDDDADFENDQADFDVVTPATFVVGILVSGGVEDFVAPSISHLFFEDIFE